MSLNDVSIALLDDVFMVQMETDIQRMTVQQLDSATAIMVQADRAIQRRGREHNYERMVLQRMVMDVVALAYPNKEAVK